MSAGVAVTFSSYQKECLALVWACLAPTALHFLRTFVQTSHPYSAIGQDCCYRPAIKNQDNDERSFVRASGRPSQRNQRTFVKGSISLSGSLAKICPRSTPQKTSSFQRDREALARNHKETSYRSPLQGDVQ